MARSYCKGRTSQIISTRIEDEVAQVIRAKAEEKGLSLSDFLKDVILQYLEST